MYKWFATYALRRCVRRRGPAIDSHRYTEYRYNNDRIAQHFWNPRNKQQPIQRFKCHVSKYTMHNSKDWTPDSEHWSNRQHTEKLDTGLWCLSVQLSDGRIVQTRRPSRKHALDWPSVVQLFISASPRNAVLQAAVGHQLKCSDHSTVVTTAHIRARALSPSKCWGTRDAETGEAMASIRQEMVGCPLPSHSGV